MSRLFVDEYLLSCLFKYATHEDVSKWIPICHSTWKWVKKYTPEFFQIHHSLSLFENLQSFIIKCELNPVKYLLSKGVSINHDSEYLLLISCSSSSDDEKISMVDFLRNQKMGLDLSLKRDALLHSIKRGNVKMVEFLYSICEDKEDYLEKIFEFGNLNLLQCLVSKGLVETFHDDAWMKLACHFGHVHFAKYFLSLGANIKKNIKFYLLVSCVQGHLEMIDFLIEQGVDIHFDNNICLIQACKSNQFSVLKHLIEKGVDFHKNNEKCLLVAIKYRKIDIVKYLISKGANIHIGNDDCFKKACKHANVEMVEFLVEQGIDVNNKQAFRLAIRNGNVQVVEYLLNQGMDKQIFFHEIYLLEEEKPRPYFLDHLYHIPILLENKHLK